MKISIGLQYGKITVVGVSIDTNKKWRLKCSCGNEYDVGHNWRPRHKQCLKCGHRQTRNKNSLSSKKWNSIKEGAKIRHIDIDENITREFLWNLY